MESRGVGGTTGGLMSRDVTRQPAVKRAVTPDVA